MTSLLLPLLLSQWLSQGMRVNDEGAVQGYAKSVDCVGTGVACSSNGFVWTIDVSGSAGAPVGATYLTMSADGTLTNEVVVPTCSAGQHLYSNGTAITCTADTGGGAPTTAQYWVGAADGTLSAEKDLSALSTGIVVNNAGTPQIMGAAACTLPNVVTGYSATGVATCGQPSNVTGSAASLSSTLGVAGGGTGNTTIAANRVFVATATDTLTAKVLPSCSGATTDKLLYNSGTSEFSCGTDQGGIARTSTTSIWSNNTTGYQNILTNSGLSTGTIYLIRCTLVHRTSTATTAVRIRFNSTGSMLWMSVVTELPSSASAMLYQHHTALATAGTAVNSVITNVVGRIDGIFATNTATDISIEGAAGTTGTVYVDRATCTVEAI